MFFNLLPNIFRPMSPPSSLSTPLRGTLHDVKTPSFSPVVGGPGGDSHRRRVTHHDRGNPNLDPEEDLSKNREFYRVQDVRPPYTYAALIRQVRLQGHSSEFSSRLL